MSRPLTFGSPVPPRRRQALTRQHLAALDAVGLLPEQQAVYFAVLANPHSRPVEIAERCHRSATEVQHTLQGLVADGLIVRSAGQAARYQAVSPEAALHERVTAAARAAEDARRTVAELEHLFKRAVHTAHPASRVEVISGAEHIAARGRQMEDDARIQVRTFDTPPYVIALDGPQAPLHFGGRRDIEYRCIYDHAALAIPGRLQREIARGQAEGEQSRVVTRLPVKMVLCDDVGALVPTALHSDVLDSAFFISPCPVLDAMSALFEQTWQQALPLASTSGLEKNGGGESGEAEQRELVSLLLAGHTDATIASTLGISARTVQRRIQDLMSELGVTSRFQAGAAAVRRNWVR